MTHIVVLFIQRGETALDCVRDDNKLEVVQYLKEVGKYVIIFYINHGLEVCMPNIPPEVEVRGSLQPR